MSEIPEKSESSVTRNVNVTAFVETILKKITTDTGLRAALTRADNPNTEPEAWSFLAQFCDLENSNERQACGLVAAVIARTRSEKNGTQTLGAALKQCKMDPTQEDDSIERKLRRLLACDSTAELIPVLRPLLRFVTGKEGVQLDFVQLLRDILAFGDKTRVNWAAQYYRKGKEEEACSSAE